MARLAVIMVGSRERNSPPPIPQGIGLALFLMIEKVEARGPYPEPEGEPEFEAGGQINTYATKRMCRSNIGS